MAWGQHLPLDLYNCNPDKLKCSKTILAYIRELVPAIGMKAYGEPILEHFANDDPIKGGYSLVQLIETSNVCAHFAENIAEMYLDVFSCMEFKEQTVIDITARYFEADEYEIAYRNPGSLSLTRGARKSVYKIVNPVISDLSGIMGKVA